MLNGLRLAQPLTRFPVLGRIVCIRADIKLTEAGKNEQIMTKYWQVGQDGPCTFGQLAT